MNAIKNAELLDQIIAWMSEHENGGELEWILCDGNLEDTDLVWMEDGLNEFRTPPQAFIILSELKKISVFERKIIFNAYWSKMRGVTWVV